MGFLACVCLQVTQLTARLEEIQSSANEASDMMEEEQAEKRELEEKLTETVVSGGMEWESMRCGCVFSGWV